MELSLAECQLLRAGLDLITIRGIDAKTLASLQVKIEKQLQKLAPQEDLKK